MEIERKYAINNLPGDLSQYRYKKIEQGYLCNKPTIRIRKSNEDYILTYKSKHGIKKKKESSAIFNQEVELLLTKEAYDNLVTKIDANLINKTRYLIPLDNGLTAELDVFEGILTGLVFVEVEFPDEKPRMILFLQYGLVRTCHLINDFLIIIYRNYQTVMDLEYKHQGYVIADCIY